MMVGVPSMALSALIPCLRWPLGFPILHTHLRDWDLLDFRGIDFDHTDHGRTALAFEYAELPVGKSRSGESSWIELDQGWDAYWHGRLCDFRKSVSTAEQKCADHGRVKFTRYRPLGRAHGDDDPRWDLYDACEHLFAGDNSATRSYYPRTTRRRSESRRVGSESSELQRPARRIFLQCSLPRHRERIANGLRPFHREPRLARSSHRKNDKRQLPTRRYSDRLWTAVIRACRALDHEKCYCLSLHALPDRGGQSSTASWSAMVETKPCDSMARLWCSQLDLFIMRHNFAASGSSARTSLLAARCRLRESNRPESRR